MVTQALLTFRNRFHPLFHLRKNKAFQWLVRRCDVAVPITITPVPHRVYVSLSKNLSTVISRGLSGEEQECANFIQIVKAGRFLRFFDVGANVGIYGFIFRSIAPTSSVTMFEPDEDNAQLILRTINATDIDGVALITAAVCEHDGTITFYKDDVSGATGSVALGESNAFISLHHNRRPRRIAVRAVALDNLRDIGDPDFIKIDVEGAEIKVLRGAEQLLARAHPALFLECDQDQSTVGGFLTERGYTFFDFVSLRKTDALSHNSLALHRTRHAELIESIIGDHTPVQAR